MDPTKGCTTDASRLARGEAPSELDQDLEQYLKWGKENLSPGEYILFAANMRKIAQALKNRAALINHTNLITLEITADVQLAKFHLHTAAETYAGKKIPYAQAKAAVWGKRREIDDDIDGLDRCISELAIEDPCRTCPKPQAIAKDFFEALENLPIDYTSKNPIRDWVISSASHVVIAEVLSQVTPGKIPAYITVGGAHALAKMARTVDPCIQKMAQDKEIQEAWDRVVLATGEGSTFAGTMAMSQGLAIGAQMPSEALYAVHDKMTAFAKCVCDKLNITDENVARISKRAFEMLTEGSRVVHQHQIVDF